MGLKEKKEKYKEISENMAKDLKPIFDRLVKKSDDYIESHNSVDTEEYAPSCGITKRLPPLTPEQKNDLERQIDITKNTIKENPDDYPEISTMMNTGKPEAGSGKGANVGHVRIKKMPFPQWLDDLESNVNDYLNPKKGRKGMDYEAAVSGRIRKAKEKLITHENSLYVLMDTSGSMWSYTDRYGNPLLKVFTSFFPTIAEKYKGQVWFVDDAPKGTDIPMQDIIELEDFKSTTKVPIKGGGGTSFWGAFEVFKKKELAIQEQNPDAKVAMIVLSDMGVDLQTHPHLIPEHCIFVTVSSVGDYTIDKVKKVVDAKPDTRKLIIIDTKEKIK